MGAMKNQLLPRLRTSSAAAAHPDWAKMATAMVMTNRGMKLVGDRPLDWALIRGRDGHFPKGGYLLIIGVEEGPLGPDVE